MSALPKIVMLMLCLTISAGCSWARINFPPDSYHDRGILYGYIAVSDEIEVLSSLKFVQIKPHAPKDFYYAKVFPYATNDGKPGFVFAQTYIADGATVALTRIFGNGTWGDMYKGKFDPLRADPEWIYDIDAEKPNYIGELSYSSTLRRFSLVKHRGQPRVDIVDVLKFLREEYSSKPEVVAKIDAELKRMR